MPKHFAVQRLVPDVDEESALLNSDIKSVASLFGGLDVEQSALGAAVDVLASDGEALHGLAPVVRLWSLSHKPNPPRPVAQACEQDFLWKLSRLRCAR